MMILEPNYLGRQILNPDFNEFTIEEELKFLFCNHFMIRNVAKNCFSNILQKTAFYMSK